MVTASYVQARKYSRAGRDGVRLALFLFHSIHPSRYLHLQALGLDLLRPGKMNLPPILFGLRIHLGAVSLVRKRDTHLKLS